jgi:hypothetical protein
MSLPNGDDDDDHWGQRPPSFGKGDPTDFHKDFSRSLMSQFSEDNATAAETSAGSNSVVSGFSSVALGDGAVATPQTPHRNIHNNAVAVPPYSSSQIHNSNSTIRNQRDRYIRQLRTLGLASGASFALAILAIVPPPVLLSMLVFLAVVVCFFYKLYQLLLWEYHRLARGRGIGDYLPSSIYEQLTQTSVHDFMSDTRNSYVNENAYLMLYMIPGLTHHQINEYVGRLSPRHQEFLHRQGLGFVLGNGFMRLIMGDERLQSEQPMAAVEEEEDDDDTAAISGVTESLSGSLASGGSANGGGGGGGGNGGAAGHHNMVPRRLELPPTIPEGVGEDDESATSELGHEEDPATQYLRHWGIEPENSNVPPENASRRVAASSAAGAVSAQTTAALAADATPSRRNRQQQQVSSEAAVRAETEAEEQVLYDAIGSAVTTYMGVAANMVQTSARRSATLISGTVFRASMGMTLIGVGVGIYGFWTGAYNPQSFFQPVMQIVQSQAGSFFRPPRRLELPPSQLLIGTTLFSGATAGVMLLFQLASAREKDKHPQKNQDCKDHDSKDESHGGPGTRKQV